MTKTDPPAVMPYQVSPAVQARQAIERKIAAQVIDDLLDAGYSITVFDGEEDCLIRSTDKAKVLEAMFSTDEDFLFAKALNGLNRLDGWVRFVYGNDGPDVINDYTVNLEKVLIRSNELSEQEERKLAR